jgi:hypothetical protein
MYIVVHETGIAPETDDHLGLVKGPEWEEMMYTQVRDGTKDVSPRFPADFGIEQTRWVFGFRQRGLGSENARSIRLLTG